MLCSVGLALLAFPTGADCQVFAAAHAVAVATNPAPQAFWHGGSIRVSEVFLLSPPLFQMIVSKGLAKNLSQNSGLQVCLVSTG